MESGAQKPDVSAIPLLTVLPKQIGFSTSSADPVGVGAEPRSSLPAWFRLQFIFS
jgi:hypothetical protein